MQKTQPQATPRPAATLLLIEWVALLALVFGSKAAWLLPLAALCVLFALLCLGRAWLALLLSGATSALFFLFPEATATASVDSLRMAVGMLLTGAVLSFCGILMSMNGGVASTIPRCLLRMMTVVHFISAGMLLASRYVEVLLHDWLMFGHTAVLVLCMADALLCLMARLYTPQRHWSDLRSPGAFFFFSWLGPEWRACLPSPREDAEDSVISLKLADMWMWPVVRGSLPWLLTTVVLISWAATCVHDIPAGSHGVRQQLGSWEKNALEPGLHLSWPSPLGGVQIVDTGRVREAVLGFRADPGMPILWERAHYEGEQQSLVGGGDDLLSISVPVHFRVSDPVLYLQQSTEPESLLVQEAQRVLLTVVLPRTAGQIMTLEREEIRAAFRQQLQHSLDAHRVGIIITDVLLRDIHPPVTVAQTFQEVVSAMEDKEATIHEAESNNTDSLFNARGFAAATRKQAESIVANRKAQVAGQTARYVSRLNAWEQNPLLFQWREGFRVFDDALGGTKKAVLDDRIQTRMPAHLDLRKVLNPDFVSSAPPAPQTLVPRPVTTLEAFDMEIEGFVKSGMGEIPAPNMAAPDGDNLLQTPPAPPPSKP